MKKRKPPLPSCPHCDLLVEDGVLIWKEGNDESGKHYGFWGCSNFKYGCRYIYSAREERVLQKLEEKLKGRINNKNN